jgi:hypothetical protein
MSSITVFEVATVSWAAIRATCDTKETALKSSLSRDSSGSEN